MNAKKGIKIKIALIARVLIQRVYMIKEKLYIFNKV